MYQPGKPDNIKQEADIMGLAEVRWMDSGKVKRLVERSVEKQKDVYTCFIDYSKAFDTVKHESLVELLLDYHLMLRVVNLY